MKNTRYEFNCKLTEDENELLFRAIDFYATSSILFYNNNKISSKCKNLCTRLNEKCIKKISN